MKNTWSHTILNHGQQAQIESLQAEKKTLEQSQRQLIVDKINMKNIALQEKRHFLFQLRDWMDKTTEYYDRGVTPRCLEGAPEIYEYITKELEKTKSGS